MNHAQRDTHDNAGQEPEVHIVQADEVYAEQFRKHGMIRQPFLDRIAGLSRGLINGNARNDEVGVQEAGVQATPQQGQQGSVPGVHAARPGAAALHATGRGPWLANHAGGRDVAQTPSNLG